MGGGKVLIMDETDLNIAQTYILRNCPEVNHFYDQFLYYIKKYEPNLNRKQIDHAVHKTNLHVGFNKL